MNRFKLLLSLFVVLVIAIWVGTGILFNKPIEQEAPSKGKGGFVPLVREVFAVPSYKVITGYGRIDRGNIAVIAEVDSHIKEIYKTEGDKIKKGEPVIALLHGITIPSPIDGILDSIPVKVGRIIFRGGVDLFSVISNTKLEASVFVPASDARFINKGDAAKIILNSKTFNGTVFFVSRVSDKSTNTFEVKINIEPAAAKDLFHNEAVKININTVKRNGYFVPTSALSANKEGIFITYIEEGEEGGMVYRESVEILSTERTGIWVFGKLPKNPLIVIRGADFLQQGKTTKYKIEDASN